MEKKSTSFSIFVDGRHTHELGFQPTLALNREDCIWHLGAKYGGEEYNEMVRTGRIQWHDDRVIITTKKD
jgi:hypothetical protein